MLQCVGVLAKQQAVTAVMGWVAQPGSDPSALGPAETYVHVLARCAWLLLPLPHIFMHSSWRDMSATHDFCSSRFCCPDCTCPC